MQNILFLLNEVLNKKSSAIIVEKIVNYIGLEYSRHNLEKLSPKKAWNEANRFIIDKNKLIYFYAPNDGMTTCPYEFYCQGKLIVDNKDAYYQITNLDDIILQMVRLFNKCLDVGIILDAYYFMLRLEDEIKEDYCGKATLVITEKAIRNQFINKDNFEEAAKYYINRFFDHFIVWNFGLSVKRNSILQNELEALNTKVNTIKIREWAGPGFDIWCSGNVQHYEYSDGRFLKEDYLSKGK